MRWACLLLPQLALDGVLRRVSDPHAPLALIDGPAQRRVLHAVNPSARALGLRPGMTVVAAQALGVQCAMVPHQADQTAHWRALLAGWAYRYSSQVSTDLPHAIVLEVGRSLRLFGPWPVFERRLREELGELGFRHRLVAAPNPYAARVLANVHASLAVDAHALQAALGRVPIERAGLPRELAHALSRMGLRRLQQVLALPREAIARRFPVSLLQHLDRLSGEAPCTLGWYLPPGRFESRIEFEYDVESSQALLFPLRRLTAELALFLAGRDGGVQRFSVRLEHEQRPESEVPVGLLAPEREAAVLFELARGRVEQVRVPAPVRGMRLVATDLPDFVPASRDLFDVRPQQAMPWEQLRERLRARLGDDAVQALGCRADHRPERVPDRGSTMSAMPPVRGPRPGWLLPQPVPLRDRQLRVLAGPERIESGWWDGDDVRRDYWLVETSLGQRAWAFSRADEEVHVPRADTLLLQGWFA